MNRSVAFSTRPREPVARRSSSTRNAGASIVSLLAYVFHPTTPTRLPDVMPSEPRISGNGNDASRGWLGRLRSWKRTQRSGSGAASASAVALVADEQRRITGSADDEHRLLEPRVEPGEVGQVGAVLTIGPHDQVVVARGRPSAPRRRSSRSA